MKRFLLLFVSCLMLFAGVFTTTGAQDAAIGVSETPELGEFLVDAEGMTLYVFTKDEPGKSNCYDDCATNWPPFYAENAELPEGVDGELTTISRDDGTEQLAFNGWPLYLWVKDTAPGDVTGEGVGEVWYVARTDGTIPGVTPEASPMASPVAAADTAVLIAETPELGRFLTDNEGMTLYIFTKDEPGKSNCEGDCLANWPPFYAENIDSLPEGFEGELTEITATDGSQQLAYNGMPLYYWVGDTAPGDTTGQGVGDVWFVATVEPAA
jgi:predicted lipoprotein with Yx(FWY)xxD motif